MTIRTQISAANIAKHSVFVRYCDTAYQTKVTVSMRAEAFR